MALEMQPAPLTGHDAEIAGLDALDVPIAPAKGRFNRVWEGLWPKLTAVGLFFLGRQTMPTIAWPPLAVTLSKLSETAITFVVILGAAPAIANGVISGVDHIPPVLLRAGRVLGARGLNAYRFVVFPAAFPGLVAGLKQGWAFAWRSLMAGELIVIIAHKPSLGVRLQNARDFSDAPGLMAAMLAILIIGIVIDSLFFGVIERGIRRRWGLDRP